MTLARANVARMMSTMTSAGDQRCVGRVRRVVQSSPKLWPAREARGKATVSLTGTWWRVDGQMRMIPAALCRSLENLHADMSYVLIGGSMWKIRRRQCSWWQ